NRVITDTLRSDLDFSFVFSSVNPKSFLAPEREPWTQPNYSNWVNVGAAGLVRGQVSVIGDKVSVGYRFFDVTAQKEVLGKMYERSKADARVIAHQMADELVRLYTGQPGVFSTQLVFAVRGENNASFIYVSDFDGFNVRKLPLPAKLNMLPSWDRA